MTIEERIYQYLFNSGMFERQARAVIEMAKEDSVLKDTLKGRWSDKVDEYPPEFIGTIVLSVDSVALRWIDANAPAAWYRPVFAKNEV